jgi:hypothetical protein
MKKSPVVEAKRTLLSFGEIMADLGVGVIGVTCIVIALLIRACSGTA